MPDTRVFLDTNVLVYLFDGDAPAKQAVAREILRTDRRDAHLVVSTQVLQEFYVTVTRKLGTPLPEPEAEAAVRDLAALEVVGVDVSLICLGIARARDDRLSFWDALIVEAGRASGCRRLLTEDLQHGRLFTDLRVEDPFRDLAA